MTTLTIRFTAIHLSPFIMAALLTGVFPIHAQDTLPQTSYSFLKTAQGESSKAFDERVELKLLQRTLVDAYKDVGKRNDKWNDKAIEFLNDSAVYFALNRDHAIEKRVALGKELQQMGCRDPMVSYCYAVALNNIGDTHRARSLFYKAHTEIMKSNYASLRKAWSASRLVRYESQTGSREIRLSTLRRMEECEKMIIQSLKNKEWLGEEIQLAYSAICKDMSLSPPYRRNIYSAIKDDPDVDPWLITMLAAHIELTRGFQGAASYEDAIKKAGDLLVKAHNLQPTYPQAAAQLIELTAQGYSHDGLSAKDWLKKAVVSRIDYVSAHHEYIKTLRPENGGSVPQMWEYGMACLNTGRFDSDLPFQLYNTAALIVYQMDQNHPWWKQEQVYEALNKTLIGYIDHYTGDRARTLYSRLSAVAYRCGHYEDAENFMTLAGDRLEYDHFKKFSIDLRLASYDMGARGSRYWKNISSSLDLINEGNYKKALTFLTPILTNSNLTTKTRTYVQDLATGAEKSLKLESGEWVNFMPADNMQGYFVYGGRWELDSKKKLLVGHSDKLGMSLISQATFEGNFEITGTLHFLKSPYSGFNGGIRLIHTLDPMNELAIYFYQKENFVRIRSFHNGYYNDQTMKVIMKPNSIFRIMRSKNEIMLMVGGKVVGEPVQIPAHLQNTPLRIGLGSWIGSDGVELGYSSLKLRLAKTSRPPHYYAARHSIESRKLVKEGNVDLAREHLQEALKGDLDDALSTMLKKQIDALNKKHLLEKGKWVDVSPASELHDWTPIHGTWEADQGTLRGVCAKGVTRIFFNDELSNCEVMLDLNVVKHNGGKNIGIMYGHKPKDVKTRSVMARYGWKCWTIENNFNGETRSEQTQLPHGKFTLRIKLVDKKIQVFHEDKMVLEKTDSATTNGQFGLCAWMNPGAIIEFSNIRIKQL